MKIFLVEDDKNLGDVILNDLKRYGYECIAVKDFNNVLLEFSTIQPDLVLMDVNLPSYDGFHWCGEIRKLSPVPIVFISARDSNMDIVMAVSKGGDDYITKPFSMEVLNAKITAILRRTYDYEIAVQNRLISEGYTLDDNKHTIITPTETIDLSRNEYLILSCFVDNMNKIMSRNQLMTVLWNDEHFIDDNTLTVNVNRLRRKLSDIGLDDIITTKKGQGYMMRKLV